MTIHSVLDRAFFLLACSLIVLILPIDALAHAPHDEVIAIVLSPAYRYDGIVFAIIRYCILRSADFGYTWRRITQGLGPYRFLDLAISPLFAIDQCLFAASEGGGIYRSNNAGLSWVAANGGLLDRFIARLSISSTFQTDRHLIAVGSTGRVYATNDAGDNWRLAFHEGAKVSAAAIVHQAMLVGTQAGATYMSEDSGFTWIKLADFQTSRPITCFAALDNSSPQSTILVGTGNGVIGLTQQGAERQVRSVGLKGRHITSLASTQNEHGRPVLFASTWREALYRSEDLGMSWEKYGAGLTTDPQADTPAFCCPHFKGLEISSSYSVDNTLFLGGFDGLFKSTDGGKSWLELREALSIGLIVGLDLTRLDGANLRITLTSYVAGVYSQDSGRPWEVNNIGLEGERLFDIALSPNYASDQTVFTLSSWVLFRSTDGGRKWERMPLGSSYRNLGFRSRLYRALRPLVGVLKACLSADVLNQLRRWLISRGVLVDITQPGFGAILAISPDFQADRTLFVGGPLGVVRSQAAGLSLQHVFGSARTPVRSLVVSPNFSNDHTVFVAVDVGLYRSLDGGTTWEPCRVGPELKSARLAISPAYDKDRTLFLGSGVGLWRSQDGGEVWHRLQVGALVGDTPVDGLVVSPFFHTDHELFVHVCGVGLFRTNDGGDSFVPVATGHVDLNPALSYMVEFPDRASLIKFSPHYDKDRSLYASSMQQLLKSSDSGASWEVLSRPVRFENVRPEISPRGEWRVIRDERFSSMSASSSSRPGDRVVMDFVGQEVRWIGLHGPSQGRAEVMIDGKFMAMVDQYAETPTFSIVSFVASGLSHGPHSISVEVSPHKNRRSSGTHIIIDAFDVI